jgi:chloramphenicol-sensitive protein RarD
VFVWAVSNDRILDASFAYYITPLINVFLGYVALRERLRRQALLGVLLAVIGVVILGISYYRIPIVSLAMASSLALYGLVRKNVSIKGMEGFAVEMIILMPAAVICLAYLQRHGHLAFGQLDIATDLLLSAAGVITTLPFIWFVKAAKRLRYASLGMMMYILPSLTFFFAVFVFEEPFGALQLVSFCCVWSALLVYSSTSVGGMRSITVDRRDTAHLVQSSNQQGQKPSL